MSISRQTFGLSKPGGSEHIPESDFSYLRTRNRLKAFELIQQAFVDANITQSTLAARMQKDPGHLNRLLNAPGNWTLDTVSDLLFAICGGVPVYSIGYPLDKPERNHTKPEWILDNPEFHFNFPPDPLEPPRTENVNKVDMEIPKRQEYVRGVDSWVGTTDSNKLVSQI